MAMGLSGSVSGRIFVVLRLVLDVKHDNVIQFRLGKKFVRLGSGLDSIRDAVCQFRLEQ